MNRLFFVALATCLSVASSATAQTNYTWTNGANDNTWNHSSTDWTTNGTTNVAYVDNNNAIFPAGHAATINITSTNGGSGVIVNSLTFNVSGYTLTNSGSGITFSGAGSITVASGASATINSATQAGFGVSVEKLGAGTLTLGNATNTYTSGGLVVTAGTLQIGVTNALANTGTMTLNGGTLGNGVGGGFATTAGRLTLDASSTIALGTGSHNIQFSNLTNAATGTLTITGWTGPSQGSGTGGRLIFTGGAGGIGTTPNSTFAGFLGHVQFSGYNLGGAEFIHTTASGTTNWEMSPVPEPTTVLGLAAGGMGLVRLRRRFRTARA